MAKYNSETRKKNNQKEMLKTILSALIIYVTVFIVFSFVNLLFDISNNNIYYLSLSQFSLSSFITGFIYTLKIRKNGMINGLIGSLPMNCLIIVISLIINKFQIDTRIIYSVISLLISSAAGGVISVNIRLSK